MRIKAVAFATGMLIAVLGSRICALGQTSGAPPAFEAASVKVSPPIPRPKRPYDRRSGNLRPEPDYL